VSARPGVLAAGLLVAGLLAGACTSRQAASAPTTAPVTVAASTTSTTVLPTTVAPSTSTSTTSTSTTSTAAPTTTVAPTTTAATTTNASADFLGSEVVGYSAQGREITAMHRGTPGGLVVLVVGVIHGNENAGLAILGRLRSMPLPVGIDLWLMDAMNPDGLANDERHNGNGVDLNRNFPHDWTQVGEPGNWEYSGTGPASEPETQAFMAFVDRIQPELTLWYHQDLFRVSPSNRRDGPLRQRYAQLTGLDYVSVSGGTYTGVAATWVRTTHSPAMSFIIELGPTLSADEADVHADAVLDISQMVLDGEV